MSGSWDQALLLPVSDLGSWQCAWEVDDDGLSAWVHPTRAGYVSRVPGSWFWPDPDVSVVGNGE